MDPLNASISYPLPAPPPSRLDEVMSLYSRHSRASSMVSTGTKVTINTIREEEEGRRIDLSLGNDRFTIGREGSFINIDRLSIAPPPYSSDEDEWTSVDFSPGSYDENSDSQSIARSTVSCPISSFLRSTHSTETLRASSHSLNQRPLPRLPEQQGSISALARSLTKGLPPLPPSFARRLSSLMPKGLSCPHDAQNADAYGSMQYIPAWRLQKRSTSLDIPRPRNQEHIEMTTRRPLDALDLHRPVKFDDALDNSYKQDLSATVPFPIHTEGAPVWSSPDNNSSRDESEGDDDLDTDPSEHGDGDLTPTRNRSFAYVDEDHDANHVPPAMEHEDDVHIHYTRMMRKIDRMYREEMHSRDEDNSKLRQMLNEKDQVYRKELKWRDVEIDELRKRVDALENMNKQEIDYLKEIRRRDKRINELRAKANALETVNQDVIDKAKNRVEDLWEMRWKDRDRHLMERMGRIELDSQKQVERAVAERDEEWADEWQRKNEHLLERLKAAEDTLALTSRSE
ncbi:MAG: hypothetical protein M1834_003299 [Cirrosporium novae-zelandiae]|nr:MAG: hypothetical protein M1834_003299 [Cirrosporium novae-zelandiae]